jgi:hypothetical protein
VAKYGSSTWRSTAIRILGGAGVVLASFWVTLELLDYFGQPFEPGEIISISTDATGHDPGWPGCTMRVIVPSSIITTSGIGIAVRFGAGPAKGLRINDVYIGYQASTGNPYEFEAAPTRLYFAGVPYLDIDKNSSGVSDMQSFGVQVGRNILISYFIDDKTKDDPVAKPPAPGWKTFYKCVREPPMLKAGGYEDRTAFVSHGVAELRIGVPK